MDQQITVQRITTLTLAISPSSFDCTNIGANTVTLTVTDESGNSHLLVQQLLRLQTL